MKKYIQNAFVIMLAFAGCQQMELTDSSDSILIAKIGDSNTRTCMGEMNDGGCNVLWSKDDKIKVFFDDAREGSQFNLISGEGTTFGKFQGKCEAGDKMIAYYPAENVKFRDNHLLGINLPARQSYVKNTFDAKSFPMCAGGREGELNFQNICSVLKVSMTGKRQIDSIVFHANSDEARVAGDAFISVTEEDGKWNANLLRSMTGVQDLVLDCGTGVMLNEEEPIDFHFVLPGFWYEGGFSLSIYTPDGCMKKSTTSSVSLVRSHIHSIPPFKLRLAGDPEESPGQIDTLLIDRRTYIELPCAAKKIEVPVRTNAEYTVECDVDWLRQVSDTKTLVTKTLLFEMDLNPEPSKRYGNICFTFGADYEKEYVTVVQDGFAAPYVRLQQDTVTVGAHGETTLTSLEMNRELNSVTTDTPWLKNLEYSESVSFKDSWKTEVTVSVSALANETRKERVGHIYVGSEEARDTILIVQPPTDYGKLIIHNPEFGNIENIIKGDEIQLYSDIKITGEMNYNDVKYFQTYASNVVTLDLSEVAFEDNVLCGFNGLMNLKKVYLPSTLIQLGALKGSQLTFAHCISLEEVDWGTNPQLEVIAGIHSYDNGLKWVTVFEGPFAYCTSLKILDIPSKVREILPGAFYKSGVEKIKFAPSASIECLAPITYNAGSFLGNPLTSIAGVFYGCDNLKTIDIPESVVEIKGGAFFGWTSLEYLDIPETVKEIDTDNLFNGCTSLNRVSLPECVTTVGNQMFRDCVSLSSVMFKGKISEICYMGFYGCESLASTELWEWDEENVIFDEYSFANTGLKHLRFPEGLAEIPYKCFSGCSDLESIVLAKSVSKVGKEAFYECQSLKSVKISGGSVEILNSFGPSLEEVIIGNDVISADCGNGISPSIYYTSSDNPNIRFVFEAKCKMESFGLASNMRSLKSITLPSSVRTITELAFANCTSLEAIDLSGVEDIEPLAFTGSGVKEVRISSDIMRTIGFRAFFNSQSLTNIYCVHVEEIGGCAFEGCKSLQNITLNKVKRIGAKAFDGCNSLRSIKLTAETVEVANSFPESLEEIVIGKDVISAKAGRLNIFAGAESPNLQFVFEDDCKIEQFALAKGLKNLTTITLPPSLKIIGSEDFANCEGLVNIDCINVEEIGGCAFEGCKSLQNITLNNVKKIWQEAFAGCNSLRSIKLMAETINIDNAFSEYIEEVVIGKDVISAIAGLTLFSHSARFFIDEKNESHNLQFVFEDNCKIEEFTLARGMKRLASITLPPSLKKISANAFFNCQSLANIDCVNVEEISENAFEGCKSLQNVALNKVKKIGTRAFAGCNSLKSIKLTAETVEIENSFPESLEEIVIGDEVVSAKGGFSMIAKGYNIFAGTENPNLQFVFEDDCRIKEFGIATCLKYLTSITLPSSVIELPTKAFYKCTSLQDINLEKIRKMGDDAVNYTAITALHLPSIISLGYGFGGCNSLRTIRLGPNVTRIGPIGTTVDLYIEALNPPSVSGFYPYIKRVYVPNISLDIYKNAWYSQSIDIVGYDF